MKYRSYFFRTLVCALPSFLYKRARVLQSRPCIFFCCDSCSLVIEVLGGRTHFLSSFPWFQLFEHIGPVCPRDSFHQGRRHVRILYGDEFSKAVVSRGDRRLSNFGIRICVVSDALHVLRIAVFVVLRVIGSRLRYLSGSRGVFYPHVLSIYYLFSRRGGPIDGRQVFVFSNFFDDYRSNRLIGRDPSLVSSLLHLDEREGGGTVFTRLRPFFSYFSVFLGLTSFRLIGLHYGGSQLVTVIRGPIVRRLIVYEQVVASVGGGRGHLRIFKYVGVSFSRLTPFFLLEL